MAILAISAMNSGPWRIGDIVQVFADGTRVLELGAKHPYHFLWAHVAFKPLDDALEGKAKPWKMLREQRVTYPFTVEDMDDTPAELAPSIGKTITRSQDYVNVRKVWADCLDAALDPEQAVKEVREITIADVYVDVIPGPGVGKVRHKRFNLGTKPVPYEPFDVSFEHHTTRTIKPGGGGDYATIALWEDASGNGDIGECYTGGDLGGASLTGHSGRILRAATGEQHDGTKSSGCYVNLDGAATDLSVLEASTISGIEGRNKNTVNPYLGFRAYRGATLDRCFVWAKAATAGAGALISADSEQAAAVVTVRNCLAVGNGVETGQQAIWLLVEAGGVGGHVYAYNNVAVNHGQRNISYYRQGAGTIHSINNIAMVPHAFGDFTASLAAATVTSTNCMSSDATANDWGGAGHLLSQTAADQFVNVASDWRTKDRSSPGWEAGARVASFSHDFEGRPRPRGNSWDMGFQEARFGRSMTATSNSSKRHRVGKR